MRLKTCLIVFAILAILLSSSPSCTGEKKVSPPPKSTPAPAPSPAPAPQPPLKPSGTSFGGSIVISNLKLLEPHPSLNSREIQFDITWDNSWRTNSGPANWDAAWVFVKFKSPGADATWRHGTLSAKTDDYTVSTNNGVAATFEPLTNGKAVLIYRSQEGKGSIRWEGVKLPWLIKKDNAIGNTQVAIFGIEMVYVPEGSFYLGDGVSPGRFHAGDDPKSPYEITAEAPKLENKPGGLWADETIPVLPGGQPGPGTWDSPTGNLISDFPTGFQSFYLMKYEMTQGLYAAFLNTLAPNQVIARSPTKGELTLPYRYELAQDNSGVFSTSAPGRACNWLSWEDALAFADWACLRPMSELEFEKACRGTLKPVPGEFAWGNTKAISVTSFDGTDGSGSERPLPSDSNTAFGRTFAGPVKAGLHEGKAGRELSGSSYWGALDLSGNLAEMTVTIGNIEGRRFNGNHGDGELSLEGNANTPYWPRIGATGEPLPLAVGYGLRGGDFSTPELYLRVSARNTATLTLGKRVFNLGFRAVTTIPQPAQ